MGCWLSLYLTTSFRYPQVACDVLSGEVPDIVDRVLGYPGALDSLFGYLNKEPLLPFPLADYSVKILSSLLARKPYDVNLVVVCVLHCCKVLEYIKSKPDFVKQIIQNIAHTPTLEFLVKVIRLEEQPQACGIVQVCSSLVNFSDVC